MITRIISSNENTSGAVLKPRQLPCSYNNTRSLFWFFFELRCMQWWHSPGSNLCGV